MEEFGESGAARGEWLKESKEYIRFVNPGDLRVAPKTCGSAGCHVTGSVRAVRTSMMTHGAMLWERGALQQRSVPYKDAHFGESYSPAGTPRILRKFPPPIADLTRTKGVLPELDPLAPMGSFAARQYPARLRTRRWSALGNRQSESRRNSGTAGRSNSATAAWARCAPIRFLSDFRKHACSIHRFRMPGTNDHPGDYRGSGCTACHVIYANDRSPLHSASYAQFGNQGHSAQTDPDNSEDRVGHPIRHEFTLAIPTSQCIVCHIHPGTNMVASYLGLHLVG